MAPPKKKATEYRGNVVCTRLTDGELSLITKAAGKQKLRVWLREVLLREARRK